MSKEKTMSETKHTPTPESLPWRSVYPAGSRQSCAGVSAGDHHVYMNTFGADDQAAGTVLMHQQYADYIVEAVNNYAALAASHKALVEALKEINKRRNIQNSISDLFHIVIFRDGQIARKADGKELCIGDLIDAALAQAEALNR